MKSSLTVSACLLLFGRLCHSTGAFIQRNNLRIPVIIFVFCLHLFPQSSFAQTAQSYKSEDFDVHRFRVKKIVIAGPANRISIKNMRNITVLDARADTSMVGFMQKKIVDAFSGILGRAEKSQTEQRVNKKPIFISIDGGLEQQATQFARQSISFPPSPELPDVLMVIKKLWLSDELNFNSRRFFSSQYISATNHDIWTSGIDVKVEFYLHVGDGYYPMYRYDSVISKTLTVSEYGPDYIAQALHLSMQRLLQMDAKLASIVSRTKFSLQDIEWHNQQAFALPVLTTQVLEKGVYMNFDEFKNNSPSQTGFELKKERLTDIIYIKKPDGTDDMIRHVWGYSDGKNAYIKSGDNFFLLQRSANAFYIFGAKTFTREETLYQAGANYAEPAYTGPVYYTNARALAQLEPFQLDWNSGKLY